MGAIRTDGSRHEEQLRHTSSLLKERLSVLSILNLQDPDGKVFNALCDALKLSRPVINLYHPTAPLGYRTGMMYTHEFE